MTTASAAPHPAQGIDKRLVAFTVAWGSLIAIWFSGWSLWWAIPLLGIAWYNNTIFKSASSDEAIEEQHPEMKAKRLAKEAATAQAKEDFWSAYSKFGRRPLGPLPPQ
jgi:hypothetical protein